MTYKAPRTVAEWNAWERKHKHERPTALTIHLDPFEYEVLQNLASESSCDIKEVAEICAMRGIREEAGLLPGLRDTDDHDHD